MNEQGVSNGKRQCTDEHIEATAGPVEQLQSAIPSTSRTLGEGAIIIGNKIYWTYNRQWIERIIENYGNTAST
jgi:hypothetical protein